jgi:nitrile hydratase accessory protein
MPLSPTSIAPEAPPFDEPWQAQVYAMTVTLNQRGVFDGSEWSEALAAEIAARRDQPYFQAWLRALEKILIAKGVARGAELHDLAEAWRAAAEATPHGRPIVLGAGRR